MKNLIFNKLSILTITLGLVSFITMSCEKNETSDLLESESDQKSAILDDESNSSGEAEYDFTNLDVALADTCKMVPDFPYENVDEVEISELLFMREEEKLARDVNQEFYDMYAIPVFLNISKSEQQHTNAVLSLITKYNLEDPITNDTRGIFINSDLLKMYNDLIELGNDDIIEALKAGALIEETDIIDLEEAIEKTDNEDISTIYTNLRNASYNHLKAFVAQLKFRGVTYEPALLGADIYNDIIGE